MNKVILFAGTTEGREIASKLRLKNIDTYVCVATTGGADMIESGGSLKVVPGRLGIDEIEKLIRDELSDCEGIVIDATHPYALEVSYNIDKAFSRAKEKRAANSHKNDSRERTNDIRLIRVLREQTDTFEGEDVFYFDDIDQLIDWLSSTKERIFSTLGAKEAMALTKVTDYANRVILRVLPSIESVRLCQEAGYPADNIICMQPPFSEEINKALFLEKKCGIMITKDTGKAGGMPEKMTAARDLGMKVGIIRRPKEQEMESIKMGLDAILDFISDL